MKHLTRQKLKKVRDGNSAIFRRDAVRKASKLFCKYVDAKGYKAIAGYYPIGSEFNILPILDRVEKLGRVLCLPCMVGKDRVLEFREWEIGEDLIKGKYSLEPSKENKLIVPDLIITPLIGFDRAGNRLGYGEGYYDRTLPKFPKATKIAVAFSNQEVEQVPVEEFDVPVDAIITEKEIIEVD